MRSLLNGLLALALCGVSAPAAETAQPVAPRLQNLGELHMPVTTSVADAQRFFDQALTFVYAFNHHEAERSFREAQRLDPECAMCFWGEALAVGPNINDPVPGDECEEQAYKAVLRARELVESSTEKERALIEALARRHPAPQPDQDARNKAYAAAMAEVRARFPGDPDVGVLYAASLMNTTPWGLLGGRRHAEARGRRTHLGSREGHAGAP